MLVRYSFFSWPSGQAKQGPGLTLSVWHFVRLYKKQLGSKVLTDFHQVGMKIQRVGGSLYCIHKYLYIYFILQRALMIL